MTVSSSCLSNLISSFLSSKASALSTKLFHQLDPETAHHIAADMMAQKIWKSLPRKADNPRLNLHLMGHFFSNPIGIAAGFDKTATALNALHCIGFGFVEVGTVTPRQQPGNPRPRLFRSKQGKAIINRMGFNSPGAIIFEKNLQKSLPKPKNHESSEELNFGFPVGINIGINKLDAVPLEDYPALMERFAPYASYIAINLSSPNTPGLRDLQNTDFLEKLLSAVQALNERKIPIFVKFSPDLSDESFSPLIETCAAFGVRGLILTNTTKSRDFDLEPEFLQQEGGLSGAPLQKRALAVLQLAARLNKGRMLLISSGGIDSGKEILNRLKHGADLVQIFSAFIFEGMPLLARLKKELLDAMDAENIENLSDIQKNFPLQS